MTRSVTRIQPTYLEMNITRKAARVIASSFCLGLPRFIPDAFNARKKRPRHLRKCEIRAGDEYVSMTVG